MLLNDQNCPCWNYFSINFVRNASNIVTPVDSVDSHGKYRFMRENYDTPTLVSDT